MQEVCRCGDETLHVSVFNWLMEHQMTERLLNMASPYLEGYLKRMAATTSGPRVSAFLDLLWKHYERQGLFLEAARLLEKLAEAHK